MALARSDGGGPEHLARIATRAQLMVALEAAKGARSYRELTEAADALVESVAPRGRGGQRWMPEPLPRGTVSDWLAGRSWPGRNKLFTFLHVCEIPVDRWGAWAAAVSRVKAAPPGRTTDDWDPIELGVHRAVRVEARSRSVEELPVLPPYVERDHDTQLRGSLRTGLGNQLIVVTGGSSVGKSRACYEAVRAELPAWPVLYPLTDEELLELLTAGIAPGSVVWLTEAQRYLSAVRGRDVAVALRRLLTAPNRGEAANRVVLLGSMWSHPYWENFTRQPEPGEDDEYPEVRDLLTRFCVRINAAEDFGTLRDEQRAQLDRHVRQDPRLRMARDAAGPRGRLIQQLAGGPLLLQRYAELEQSNPVAHAVLTAAMDTSRIGYQSPLSAALLAAAVPGYLTREQLVASADWFNNATAIAGQEIHGVRALTPIRTDKAIGPSNAFLLHDYLAQHALGCRRRSKIPESVWNAAGKEAHDPQDLMALSDQADRRGLRQTQLRILRQWASLWRTERTADRAVAIRVAADLARLGDANLAVELLKTCADAGNGIAARRLAGLLAERGDVEEALAVLRARTDNGDGSAARQLIDLLVRLGDLARLRERADAGDEHAAMKLIYLLVEAGDLDGLRARADTGDEHAAGKLAGLLAQRGDLAGLRQRTEAGDGYAARKLAGLLAERGDTEAALTVLRAQADAGDGYAALQLADLLAEQGDVAGLRQRADAGEGAATRKLMDLLIKRGDLAGLRERAEAGSGWAAEELAKLLAERGDVEGALAVLRTRADGGDQSAAMKLARLLAERGDLVGLRERTDAGDWFAPSLLVQPLVERGDVEGALAVLRTRPDADVLAAMRLVDLLVERGDLAGLRERADAGAGDGPYATARLIRLLIERGDLPGLRERAEAGVSYAAQWLAELLAQRGDVEEALDTLRTHAETGDGATARQLAGLLAERGDVEESLDVLRTRADTGDEMAAHQLADLLADQGDLAGLRKRTELGDGFAALWLTDLLIERGDLAGLREWAEASDQAAAMKLADLLVERGDDERALALLRIRAAAGDGLAVEKLAGLLVERGNGRRSCLCCGRMPMPATGSPQCGL